VNHEISPKPRLFLAAVVALIVTLLAIRVAAADPVDNSAPKVEPPVHLLSAFTIHTDAGSTLRHLPGYCLTEATWDHLDSEMKKAQNEATRYKAESESLKKSMRSGSLWWTGIGIGVVAGIVEGVAAF